MVITLMMIATRRMMIFVSRMPNQRIHLPLKRKLSLKPKMMRNSRMKGSSSMGHKCLHMLRLSLKLKLLPHQVLQKMVLNELVKVIY